MGFDGVGSNRPIYPGPTTSATREGLFDAKVMVRFHDDRLRRTDRLIGIAISVGVGCIFGLAEIRSGSVERLLSDRGATKSMAGEGRRRRSPDQPCFVLCSRRALVCFSAVWDWAIHFLASTGQLLVRHQWSQHSDRLRCNGPTEICSPTPIVGLRHCECIGESVFRSPRTVPTRPVACRPSALGRPTATVPFRSRTE